VMIDASAQVRQAEPLEGVSFASIGSRAVAGAAGELGNDEAWWWDVVEP
jgi:hypothetical protein